MSYHSRNLLDSQRKWCVVHAPPARAGHFLINKSERQSFSKSSKDYANRHALTLQRKSQVSLSLETHFSFCSVEVSKNSKRDREWQKQKPCIHHWLLMLQCSRFSLSALLLLFYYGIRRRWANGMAAYTVTLVTYLSLWWFGIFNPSVVYDHLGEIFSALSCGSLVFCIFLYIKGHLAPSSTDSGSSENIIIDFYWDMELYPRIGKNFDVKVFTSCRFGMMSWAVLALTYCIKQLALCILAAGVLSIYVNYDCDRQRQEFRRTNGKCLVWGKAPSKIVASDTTTSGESKTSLLLTSGRGLSRHFHDVPEILAALFWTVPALFNHFLPYFYVIFLTILLFDRAKRDDDRCGSKYGKYCEKVRYRIVPGIHQDISNSCTTTCMEAIHGASLYLVVNSRIQPTKILV